MSFACCFTGHRSVDPAERAVLIKKLDDAISELAMRGCNRFICGGALGFDTLAAQRVLELREDLGISLRLILPHAGQEERWSEQDKRVFKSILARADRFEYLYGRYVSGCMHERNRKMVDLSSTVVCFMRRSTGGTAYTVTYAEQMGRQIIRL